MAGNQDSSIEVGKLYKLTISYGDPTLNGIVMVIHAEKTTYAQHLLRTSPESLKYMGDEGYDWGESITVLKGEREFHIFERNEGILEGMLMRI